MREWILGLEHSLRTYWRSSPAYAIGSAAACAGILLLAVAGAALVEYANSALPVQQAGSAALALAVALAVLPAVGGGADEDVSALAAVRAGPAFRAGSHLGATATDIAGSILAPAVVLLCAYTSGWSGLLLGAALALCALGTGQMAGALAARSAEKLGPSVTLVVVAGCAVLALRLGESSGVNAWQSLVAHPWLASAGLLAAGALALGASVLLTSTHARTLGAIAATRLVRGQGGSVVSAALLGCARSTLARNSAITALLLPALLAATGAHIEWAMGVFVVASAAAMVGANGFGYDGGAPVWMLGRAGLARMLAARYCVTLIWCCVIAGAYLLGSWATGQGDGRALPVMLAALLSGAAAGLVPSVKRPVSVDMDEVRAQPAPPASAVGVMARTLLLVAIALTAPAWLFILALLGYTVLAFAHARRVGADPLALAALS